MRALALLLFAASPEVRTEAPEPAAAPPRNFANLRIGGAIGGAEGRPEICGEIAPLSFLSVEGCGTGSGFLHDEDIAEMSHYRLKWSVADWDHGTFSLQPIVGAGFAELQLGLDDAGFDFDGTGSRGLETAGAEVMGAVRMLLPMWSGFELVGEINAGIAWMPYASELVRPTTETPVFAGATVGVGF